MTYRMHALREGCRWGLHAPFAFQDRFIGERNRAHSARPGARALRPFSVYTSAGSVKGPTRLVWGTFLPTTSCSHRPPSALAPLDDLVALLIAHRVSCLDF